MPFKLLDAMLRSAATPSTSRSCAAAQRRRHAHRVLRRPADRERAGRRDPHHLGRHRLRSAGRIPAGHGRELQTRQVHHRDRASRRSHRHARARAARHVRTATQAVRKQRTTTSSRPSSSSCIRSPASPRPARSSRRPSRTTSGITAARSADSGRRADHRRADPPEVREPERHQGELTTWPEAIPRRCAPRAAQRELSAAPPVFPDSACQTIPNLRPEPH